MGHLGNRFAHWEHDILLFHHQISPLLSLGIYLFAEKFCRFLTRNGTQMELPGKASTILFDCSYGNGKHPN